jgi:hypothetical protein
LYILRCISSLVIFLTAQTIVYAQDAQKCKPVDFCPHTEACADGTARNSSDLQDELGSYISWRSQIYDKLEKNGAPRTCFFRAILLTNATKSELPLFWEPGGLKYDNPISDTKAVINGCIVSCNEGPADSKAATESISGNIYSGSLAPNYHEKAAPAWGPENGWTAVDAPLLGEPQDKPGKNQNIPTSQEDTNTAIVSDNTNVSSIIKIEITSTRYTPQDLELKITNSGDAAISLTCNTLVNDSLRESALSGKPQFFKGGGDARSYKLNVAATPADKAATAVLADSQCRIEAEGSATISTSLQIYAASNGQYPQPPAEFSRPKSGPGKQ